VDQQPENKTEPLPQEESTELAPQENHSVPLDLVQDNILVPKVTAQSGSKFLEIKPKSYSGPDVLLNFQVEAPTSKAEREQNDLRASERKLAIILAVMAAVIALAAAILPPYIQKYLEMDLNIKISLNETSYSPLLSSLDPNYGGLVAVDMSKVFSSSNDDNLLESIFLVVSGNKNIYFANSANHKQVYQGSFIDWRFSANEKLSLGDLKLVIDDEKEIKNISDFQLFYKSDPGARKSVKEAQELVKCECGGGGPGPESSGPGPVEVEFKYFLSVFYACGIYASLHHPDRKTRHRTCHP
jgi:hypothetical protein